MTAIYAGLALLAGTCLSIQIGLNNEIRAGMGNPLSSALWSFLSGGVALGVVALISQAGSGGSRPLLAPGWARGPWWIWGGGVMGAGYVLVTVTYAPRLGAAGWLGLVVAGQILTSMVLDHFGLIGFSTRPINLPRVVGVLVMLAGVAVILRN
ncbi:DMT family transporter [Tundrisphaera sp. TA3]|uniref:DMT family transporter n=1 Tax=Tundrisphaera sp. TA3 TaxID=3435775 RepID=UPI003EBA3456